MTTQSPPKGNWEKDGLENPVGCTAWVLNPLTHELTVRNTFELAKEEFSPWHGLRDDIESAVISEGAASICDRAFKFCLQLEYVQIQNTVTSIGDEAFFFCPKMESITIPDSVNSVGDAAFARCLFTSIKIPRSVVSFRGNPFSYCDCLKEIDVSENQNFVFVDGVLMNREMTQIIYCSFSKTGDYSIPNTVTTICGGAFTKCKFESITIPDSVREIGDLAFDHCNELTSIAVPGGVETLGQNPFFQCWKLLEVIFIGESQNFKVVDGVLFNKEMTRLIWCSYQKSGSYEAPSTVETIDLGAFRERRNLTSLVVPDIMKEIPVFAFFFCSGLKRVTIPNSVTFIGAYAFAHCTALKSIIIPDSVAFVEKLAFSYCDELTSVTLPSSIAIIPEELFFCCNKLASVALPDSIVSIESRAFGECTALKS